MQSRNEHIMANLSRDVPLGAWIITQTSETTLLKHVCRLLFRFETVDDVIKRRRDG